MFFQGLIGVGFFICLAFIFSENQKMIDWKVVIWGIFLQFIIAGVILGNYFLSLFLCFLFVYAIVTYNIHVILKKKHITELLLGFIATVMGILLFTIFIPANYAPMVRNILWNIFLVIACISVISRKKLNHILPKYWSNIFGILICIAVYATLFVTKQKGSDLIHGISNAILKIISFSKKGGEFLYGDLFQAKFGWIFIIHITTSMIFFITLISIIDSLGLLNAFISSIARFIYWNMNSLGIKPLSGIEFLASISSIPIGQNVVFIVKNYLDNLTNSEIILILSGIMATISAESFAVLVSMGISADHLLAASVMSIPSVITLSKILVPETEKPMTQGGEIQISKSKDHGKPFSAMMSGVHEGIQVSLVLAGMLIVVISFVSMLDYIFAQLDIFIDGHLLNFIFKGTKNSFAEFKGIIPGSLKTFFGYLFSPLAFAIGTPVKDILKVGYLMGAQFSINEVVAFTKLREFMNNNELQPISIIISNFALCGFSNPGTIFIILGIISPYVKNKKKTFFRYSVIALFIGISASWSTAAIASLFINMVS